MNLIIYEAVNEALARQRDEKVLVCHETYGMTGADIYIHCRKPAGKFVYHPKDRRAYPMCDMCAHHNIRNRGGIWAGSLERPGSRVYQPIQRESVNTDLFMISERNRKEWDADPAPYCQYCGARRRRDCDCGPLPANH